MSQPLRYVSIKLRKTGVRIMVKWHFTRVQYYLYFIWIQIVSNETWYTYVYNVSSNVINYPHRKLKLTLCYLWRKLRLETSTLVGLWVFVSQNFSKILLSKRLLMVFCSVDYTFLLDITFQAQMIAYLIDNFWIDVNFQCVYLITI